MGWRNAPIVGQAQDRTPAWQAAPTVGHSSGEDLDRRRVPVPQQQVTEGAPGGPQQLQEGPDPTRFRDPRTPREGAGRAVEVAHGAGEVGLMGLTGGIAEVLAGLGGIESFIQGDPSGERTRTQTAVDRIEKVQDLRTFQPRTETGQRMAERAGQMFSPFIEGGPRVQDAMQDAGAAALPSVAANTAIQLLPAAVGMRPGGKVAPLTPRTGQAARDAARVEGQAAERGVDLGAGLTAQRGQIVESGRQLAPGERTASMPDIQQVLIRERDQARADRTALYEEARGMRAGVDVAEVQNLPNIMRDAIRDFGGFDDMPRVRKMMDRIDRVESLPEGSAVQLRAIDDYRRALNRNMPSKLADERQYTAMSIMKGRLDNWMDTMFDADMIKGDPAAVAKWQEARRAHKDYRERFSDNRVIRNLVEMDANPAEARRWVFGASVTGAKAEAATVVRRIREEVGEDSPQFLAFRQDALLDVMEPLLRDEPNLRAYLRNHDKLVRGNPPLARELFGDSLESLNNLRDIAAAHQRRPVAAMAEIPGLSRALSVAAFGHQLARKSLLVRGGSAGIQMLSRSVDKGAKRRMMGEMMGYDPDLPIFGAGAPLAAGAAQEFAAPPGEGDPMRFTPGWLRDFRGGP